MAVRVYHPRIQVTLRKLVSRRGDGVADRYAGAARDIDLTPFLGEHGMVRWSKSLYEAAGGFSITLPDQPHPDLADSLHALVEPMDMIEIRAAREPHRHAGQPLPLVMRGFVSQVRRPQGMTPDGSPQRSVAILGQDCGKLWQIHQLFPEAIYANAENPYLNVFRMQAVTGMDAAFLPVSEMLRQLTDRVMNKRVEELSAFAERQIRPFRVDATVTEGVVSPNLIMPFQGPYWSLVELVADRPWNEAFIEDEEEGPVLRFRPAPYKDTQGRFILPGATDPGTIELDDADAAHIDLWRSDQRVANFFYVPPGASMLDTSQAITVATLASGAPFDTDHGNNKPELYGLRKMLVESRLLPNGTFAMPAQLPSQEAEQSVSRIVLWHEERGRLLRLMNRDNSVLEEGMVQAKGREDQKPGRYLRMTRGGIAFEAYITRVDHTFGPLQSWTAQMQLERGTGFLERIRTTGSPYFAEQRKGPYDR